MAEPSLRRLRGRGKPLLFIGACIGGGYALVQRTLRAAAESEAQADKKAHIDAKVPAREEQIAKLQSNKYDLLVIGGGATGAGIALDATTRGLKVALVEKDDFAASTSSRSTKLIHGGVRYLEAAVKNLDPKQLSLVFDALHERSTFLYNAPHLTRKLPIMTPCYNWWEIPYYWVGLKLYDVLSLNRKLASARYVSRKESLLQFPMLSDRNLKGSVVYYDGQMDDSRMNVGLAVTAAFHGASVANHVEVVSLKKRPNSKGSESVAGATVRDTLTGKSWDIDAEVVVNATGPHVDLVRKMDDPTLQSSVTPSRGVHIILPDYYSPTEMGLIIPKTIDNRVIFLLPWLGRTLAGTTDTKTELEADPKPKEEEIQYILDSISQYVTVNVRRDDVSAAWSGIRPLASDPKAKNTAAVVRDHLISVSESGLVTITGGKWTTYRSMSQEAVDKVIEIGKFRAGPCKTDKTMLLGAGGWNGSTFLKLAQKYSRTKQGNGRFSSAPMNKDIAVHLSQSYGTRSHLVAELAQGGFGKRLAHNLPYIEAEVLYSCRNEYAATAVDVIARRLRLAFLDSTGAQQALPRVIELMAKELNWDSARIAQERKQAQEFLHSMC